MEFYHSSRESNPNLMSIWKATTLTTTDLYHDATPSNIFRFIVELNVKQITVIFGVGGGEKGWEIPPHKNFVTRA